MSETAEEREPTTVDRLANFISAHLNGETAGDEDLDELAHAILTGFFKVDDARAVYCVPMIESGTLKARVAVYWGPLVGYLSPLEARSTGLAFLETAETAEIEETMLEWLLKDSADGPGDPAAKIAGAVKILTSFRAFRLEREQADPA